MLKRFVLTVRIAIY